MSCCRSIFMGGSRAVIEVQVGHLSRVPARLYRFSRSRRVFLYRSMGRNDRRPALFPLPLPSRLSQTSGVCSRSLRELCGRGVCQSNTILLRQTICGHLRRSRLQEILDVLQRIRLRFLGACGLASASSSLRLATKDYSDRLLAGFIALSQGLDYNARHQSTGVTNE